MAPRMPGSGRVAKPAGSMKTKARHSASIAAEPHRQAGSPPYWVSSPDITMPNRRPAASGDAFLVSF